MPVLDKKKLFGGWATAHVPVVSPVPRTHFPPPALSIPLSELKLAISKRPGANIEMFSPTRRAVGDHYFRAFPMLYFAPQEIIRVLCVLWRHSAVIRYSEVWGAFTIEQFVRRFRGTARLQRWIEQVTRGEGKREDRVPFSQFIGSWVLSHPQSAYPHIRRWSLQAIEAAKIFTEQYKK